MSDQHRDLLRNDWANMQQSFMKRVYPGDPEWTSPNLLTGWSSYVSMTEPHTMEACPYKAADVTA